MGESCLVHRSDRCCLGSQRFFSCTGLWTILNHDGKRPFFLFRGYGILINLVFDATISLIYRYTVYIYIYVYIYEHIPFYIIHDSFLGMRCHAFQSSIAPIACPLGSRWGCEFNVRNSHFPLRSLFARNSGSVDVLSCNERSRGMTWKYHVISRWWQPNYLLFSPRKLGKMNPFWLFFLQRGWLEPPTRIWNVVLDFFARFG